MSYTIGTIREFRTANFRVIVDAVEDDSPDLSWDEDGDLRAKIEAGEYLLFCARARVLHDELGELASDYLGGCIYESLGAFQDHRECGAQTRKLKAETGRDVCVGSYFAQMVRDVCEQGRARLIELRDGVNGLTIRGG